MSSQKYNYLFKILLLGGSSDGKKAFVLRFTDDSFTANHLSTISIDFKVKIINFENKIVKLGIIDTAGEERFGRISKSYFKGVNGIILMYDVTEQNSFKDVRSWMKQIPEHGDNSVRKVLVGLNCDKPDRVVSEEEGKKLAEEYNIVFFETSAKTNKNVSEVFNYLVKEMIIEKDREELKKIEKEKESFREKMNILMKYISF